MKKESPFRICVISFPMPSVLVVNVLLYSFVKILEPICAKVYVVTSNIPKDRIFTEKIIIKDIKTAMHFRDTIHPMWWSTLLQLFKIIIIQMKMCLVLTKISKEIDIAIFYGGVANLFPPVLMAKALRKKVITAAIGLGSLSYKKDYNKGLFSLGGAFAAILSVLERVNFSFSDLIIAESRGAVNFLGLDKYKQKVVASGARYIDTELLQIKKDLRERKNWIGYIGRLNTGKGVMNFVEAMPLILEKQDNLKFFLGGHGPLYDRIKDKLRTNNISQKVELTGWLSHDKVADYLNELKLFVLPSSSEGLPTGVLEAMACGAVVLATPVGGVPDVIKDGETGFILENNSAECIAENVIRALEHPNLDEIVKNARALVEREFTYEAAVERYRKILENI
ncbi:MAG: glycosyltransferase family 4 protein [Methanophagales archaeon]|nr:glycosyltransferase family 4 protein [Methanophagales archaeon]